MKMSPAYLAEAATWLASRGFTLAVEERALEPDDRGRVCTLTRYRLQRGEDALCLEHAAHPAADDRYYLAVERYGELRAPLFPLDSWRLHDDRIELKYEVNPETGMGHTLELRVPAP